jgi:bacteriocin-like protein
MTMRKFDNEIRRPNNETRELTIDELDTVSGGGTVAQANSPSVNTQRQENYRLWVFR